MKNSIVDKEKKAIQALKMFEPESEPYYLCYSGGKDSDCIRILAQLAGVKHDIVHNLTTVDAPETIHYINSIPNVIIDKARYADGTHKTMWNLIVKKKIPPTRFTRYCCEELKERGGDGRLKITGVRSLESKNRYDNSGEINIIGKPKTTQKYLTENDVQFSVNKKGGVILNFDNSDSRRAVEHCFRTTSTLINPILSWSDFDVWEFLHYYGCDGNPLYHCGSDRVGCIGCPLADYRTMRNEFKRYPKYMHMYINAFSKMLVEREKSGRLNYSWFTGDDVFHWWLDLNPDQLTFDGFDLLDC